jgi:DNA-binding response OmpR family regulator
MPRVVALVIGVPPSAPDTHLGPGGVTIEVIDAESTPPYPIEPKYDLLVLDGMDVGAQQQWIEYLRLERRWRLVPVLYLISPETIGMPIPGTFRPEIDGILRAAFGTRIVFEKISELAKDGVADTSPVVAGAFELDPLRCRMQVAESEVELTEREAEILAVLLNRANDTVTATEIVELGWGTKADARHLQNLRRHMSNIRRKLNETSAAGAVHTIRGIGYRIAV